MFFIIWLLFVLHPINSLPTDFQDFEDVDFLQNSLSLSAESGSSDSLIAECDSDNFLHNELGDTTSIFRRAGGPVCLTKKPPKKPKIKPSSQQNLDKAPEITTVSDPQCVAVYGFPIYVTCGGSEYGPNPSTNIVKIMLNCVHGYASEIEARTPFRKAIVVAQYCCKEFVPVTSRFLIQNHYLN